MCEKKIHSYAEKYRSLYKDEYSLYWGTLYNFLEGQSTDENNLSLTPATHNYFNSSFNPTLSKANTIARNSRNLRASAQSYLISHYWAKNKRPSIYKPLFSHAANCRLKSNKVESTASM
jgi:hypothetical protein